MEIGSKEYNLESGPLHIYFLGDVHIGNTCSDEKAYTKAINIIADDPFTKGVFLMGDYCDFITHTGDKRFDPLGIIKEFQVKDLRNLPQAEADRFMELTKPIEDYVIGILSGNHEEKFTKYNTFDVYKYICEHYPNAVALGQFGYFQLKLVLHKVRRTVDIVLRHGGGGYAGSTKGYPLNKVIKVFDGQVGDIHVMGHIHRMAYTYKNYEHLNRTGTAVVKDRVYYAVSGTFLQSYVLKETNYIEARGGEPTTIGMLRATIQITKHKEKIAFEEIAFD